MSDQAQAAGGKGRKALLWTTVAIIIVAGAGLTSYKYSLQNTISAQIEKRGGKAESISADFFGNIHMKNVTLPLKDGQTVNIERFEGRPEILFLNGKIEAAGITTQFDDFKINIPHMQIADANLNRQMLADVFGGNSELTPAQRVERFSAKNISFSEIHVEQAINDTKQTTIYKNISLNDVQHGMIASLTLDSGQVDMNIRIPQADGSINEEQMRILMGQSEGKDIDAAFMTRLYTEKAGTDNPSKQVQGAYSTKDIIIQLPEATATIDKVKSTGFSMRLPEFPLLDIIHEMAAAEKIDAITEEERRELFRKLIAIYEIIDKGDAEILGFKITPEDKTQPSGTIDSLSMTFDKLAFDMSFKGMSIGTENDYFKLDAFSWTGFDYASTLEAVKKLVELSKDERENFPFTTLIPTIGTIRVKGIDADLPNTEAQEADETEDDAASALPARVKFKAKDMRFAMLNPVNGIPTDIQISYDDLDIPVPHHNDNISRQLRSLGFERFVLSSNTHILWDEPTETLIIKDMSYKGDKLGSIALSGVMGGMSRDFFSGDKALMQIAAFGLKAKEVNLRLEDKGMLESAFKIAAEENGASEEATRQLTSLAITLMATELAGANPQIQEAVKALNKFIADPNIFTLSIKSKNENGIGPFEMLAVTQNPMSLLDKVNINAVAE